MVLNTGEMAYLRLSIDTLIQKQNHKATQVHCLHISIMHFMLQCILQCTVDTKFKLTDK